MDFKVLSNIPPSSPTTISLTGLLGFSQHNPLLSYLHTFVSTVTSTKNFAASTHLPAPILTLPAQFKHHFKSVALSVESVSPGCQKCILSPRPGPTESESPGVGASGLKFENHCSMIHFMHFPTLLPLPTAITAGHGTFHILPNILPSLPSCLSPTPT